MAELLEVAADKEKHIVVDMDCILGCWLLPDQRMEKFAEVRIEVAKLKDQRPSVGDHEPRHRGNEVMIENLATRYPYWTG